MIFLFFLFLYTQVREALKPQVSLLIGAPGSLRSTVAQATGRVKGYKYIHIPSLLRSVAESEGQFSEEVNQALRFGHAVDIQVMLAILKNEFKHSNTKRFLLDGISPHKYKESFFHTIISRFGNINIYITIHRLSQAR